MEVEKLRSIIYSKIDELPTLPTVVPRILSLMEEARADVGKVTEAISHDPALTSKILKVANSAYYGFPQKISSLDRAVALLGFNMVKSLAISVGVIRSLPSKGLAEVFNIEDLWVHSLAVATAMRLLEEGKGPGEHLEALFIVGLLHDVGKIILAEFLPDEFAAAVEKSNSDVAQPLYETERHIIGIDHGEVGGMLLARWKFPEVIVVPVTMHHSPEGSWTDFLRETAVLVVADALARQACIGNACSGPIGEVPERALESLEFGGQAVEKVREELTAARDGIYSFFQAFW